MAGAKPSETTELRPCPACGQLRSKWAFAVDGFPYVRCLGCATHFVAPLPDPDVVASTYLDPEYHPTAATEAHRMRAEAEPRARRLHDLGVRTVLEIGCGAGFFLDACRDLGMEVEGIDPAPTGRVAADKGHRVHDIWLEEHRPDHAYDAIALWEVIEHLPDPAATLALIRGWLSPEGRLALSTPSMSGIPAKVLGRRFPMVTPPDHLTLFSREGLARLLLRTGYAPERWTSFSGLDSETLERGFQRRILGRAGAAGSLAKAFSRLARRPMQWADRAGLGTSFELYAKLG